MLLLLLVGGVLALIEQRNSLESTVNVEVDSSEPDYYLDGADMTRFRCARRGDPVHELAAYRAYARR